MEPGQLQSMHRAAPTSQASLDGHMRGTLIRTLSALVCGLVPVCMWPKLPHLLRVCVSAHVCLCQCPHAHVLMGTQSSHGLCFPPRACPGVPEARLRAAEPSASAPRKTSLQLPGPRLASPRGPDRSAGCGRRPEALLSAGEGAKVDGGAQAGGEESLAHQRL